MTSESPSTKTQITTPVDAQQPTTKLEPGFGWTAYAELINGRFAMLGFVGLLILEFFTRQDFFTWVGLR
ncbi:MAG: chlorophyll a/b-binding protein [Thainema sp.]